MPDQKLKHTNVNYNRDEIRKRIPKLSFREARRQKGPIYDALIRELYEDGCTKVACHFQRLVDEEKQLLQRKTIIGAVYEEPEFLLQLFDNVKNAELAARLIQCNGMLACLKLLHQTIFLVEKYSVNAKYDWLLMDIYEIILEYVLKIDPDLIILNELKAKIYYKYGNYFSKKGDRLDWMIEILTKALHLSKGQIWESDFDSGTTDIRTLHEVVARRLAKTYLAYARKFLPNHPEEAMKLSMKAILTIAECGFEENKKLLCSAYLSKIEFLIECQKYEMALKQIRKVKNQIDKDDRPELIKIKCELYKFEGICYYNLNDASKAFVNFQSAYVMSRNFGLRSLMGEIWLYIGKTHAKSSVGQSRARDAFQTARGIFRKMKDYENMKKSDYLLAKLRATKIFPRLISTIKSKDYCDFYNLRLWKNQCVPFWQEEEDPLMMQKSLFQIFQKLQRKSQAQRASEKSVKSEMRDSQVQQTDAGADADEDDSEERDRRSEAKKSLMLEALERDLELPIQKKLANLNCLLLEEAGKREEPKLVDGNTNIFIKKKQLTE